MNNKTSDFHILCNLKFTCFYFWLFIINIFSSSSSSSQNVLNLDTGPRALDLHKQAYFYHDTTNKLTIADFASEKYAADFKPDGSLYYTFRNPEAAHWIKIRIAPNHTTEKDWYFIIWTPTTRQYELYVKDSTSNFRLYSRGGMDYPFSQRESQTNRMLFKIPLTPNDTTSLYLKLISYQANLEIISSSHFAKQIYYEQMVFGIIYGILLALLLYNLFLYFSIFDKSYLYYVLYLASYLVYLSSGMQHAYQFLWPNCPWLGLHANGFTMPIAFLFSLLFCKRFLFIETYAPQLKIYFIAAQIIWILNTIYLIFVSYHPNPQYTVIQIALPALFSLILIFVAGVVTHRKGFKPAKFYLIAWLPLIVLITIKLITIIFSLPDASIKLFDSYLQLDTPILAPIIEAILLSLALAYRINLLKQEVVDNKLNIEKIERDKETEKRELIEKQKEELEIKVEERTHDLSQSLQQLKETQLQLVQSEKMASLGQLTAGIAHEIQNPLNFVNNFSELSQDLIQEIENAKSEQESTTALNDLKLYLNKINTHGKRADSIVKNMLEHSRVGVGQKKLTNINNLCEEFLNLSYHGFRAKDPSFTCIVERNFAKNLPDINIIPQDISRVLLNICNNSFYAVNEKSKELNRISDTSNYQPNVSLTTIKQLNNVTILIKDNGKGIPKHIQDRIFEPFFTTKPTGQGTGLGLSLSYDIIKVHNGQIKVDSEPDLGTEFTIQLPI